MVAGPWGEIRIPGDAIARLVVDAAQLTQGVRVPRPRRGVDVTIEHGRATVELQIAARLGTLFPHAARNVQATVHATLGLSAGLEVDAVDVTVTELDP